jgi:hypothetical protein
MRLPQIPTLALVAAFSILGAASCSADVIFCNQFGQVVNVAMVYPQTDGSFISRGWLSLSPGNCASFDTALHVRTFFFRGETPRYRDAGGRYIRTFWGKGRLFATWENDNYQYYDAARRVLKSTLEEFIPGPEAENGDVAATVTFMNDGAITIRGQEPEPGKTSDPGKAADPRKALDPDLEKRR